MKVRVVKLFGREVLRVESYDQVTVSDLVAALVSTRGDGAGEDDGEDDDGLVPCDDCGEMYDPDVAQRFADMTEQMLWDARADDDDDDFPRPCH